MRSRVKEKAQSKRVQSAGDKQTIVRLISTLLAIVLVSTLIPAFALATPLDSQNGEDVSGEYTGEQSESEELLETTSTPNEDASTIKTEGEETDEVLEVQTPVLLNDSITAPDKTESPTEDTTLTTLENSGFSAVFDYGASNIDLSGNNDGISVGYSSSSVVPRILNVTEVFSEVKAPKSLELKLGYGMALSSAPGMVCTDADANTWSFDGNTLVDLYKGVITGAVWAPDSPIEGRQPQSGTLTYALAQETNSINININTLADTLFLPYGQDQTFTNAITVITAENGSNKNSAVLEQYTIEDGGDFYLSNIGIQSPSAAPGENYKLPMVMRHAAGNVTGTPWLHRGISFTVGLPKAAGLSGVEFTLEDGTESSLNASNCNVSAIDTQSSSTHDYVTLTIAQYTQTNAQYFALTGTIAADAAPGNYPTDLKSGSVTLWDGATCALLHSAAIVKVPDPNKDLQLIGVEPMVIYEHEKNTPAALRPLGLLGLLKNDNTYTVSGRRMSFAFDTKLVGVKAVRVPCDSTLGATNIVAKTTKNRVINIDYVPSIIQQPAVATISLADPSWGEKALAADEYISTLEYDLGTIAERYEGKAVVGYAHSTDSNGAGLYYYGVLLDGAVEGASYQASAELLRPSNPDGGNEAWIVEGSVESVSVVSKAEQDSLGLFANASSGKTVVTGGSAVELSCTLTPASYRYENNALSCQGWVAYVREAKGLTVDPNSVKVVWRTGSEETTFRPTNSFVDGTGCTVYEIEIPNKIVGYSNESMTSYGALITYAKVSANNTAVDRIARLSEIFQGHVYNSTGATMYATAGRCGNYTSQELFGLSSYGQLLNGGFMATPLNDVTLTIQGNSGFNVQVAASSQNGSWKTYDPADAHATTVAVNPRMQALYAVDVVNNAGKEVGSNVFSALIPVPKEGENTQSTAFQTEDFSWSLDLLNEIVVPGYQAFYAETYVSSVNSSEWKGWTEVEPSEVRMIKLMPSAPVATDVVERIVIAMDVAHRGQELIDLQGNINVFSAQINYNLDGNSNTKYSDPVALLLNTGVIQGTVLLDKDCTNSTALGAKTPVEGVTVTAFEQGTDTLLDSTKTQQDGSFCLLNLGADEVVDIILNNPGTSTQPLRYTYPTHEAEGEQLCVNALEPSGNVKDAPTTVTALLQHPWTLTYDGNGATSGSVSPHLVYFNDSFTTAASDSFSRTGYTFAGWTTTINGQQRSFDAAASYPYEVADNLTLAARWTPNTGTNYKVEHYLVNTAGVARLDHVEALKGKTDTMATAVARNYAPTHAYNASYPGTQASGIIVPDGTLVLRLYYPINTYTVTFVDYDNRVIAVRTGVPYAGSALAPASPLRIGHTFIGWDRSFNYITSNIVVTAQYAPLTFTVTFVDGQGTTLQSSTVDYGQDVTPPSAPSRTGYIFDGWDRDDEAWTNVRADAIITAQWTPESVPPTPGPTTSTVTPFPEEVASSTLTPQSSPMLNIFGNEVPLFGAEESWSLFDLICAVLGVALLVMSYLLVLTRKKRIDEAAGRKQGYRRVKNMWIDDQGNIVDENKEGKRQVRKIPMIITAVVMLIMIALFVLTQDMTLTMALFDMWSIVFAILLVLDVLAVYVTLRRVRIEDDELSDMQVANA